MGHQMGLVLCNISSMEMVLVMKLGGDNFNIEFSNWDAFWSQVIPSHWLYLAGLGSFWVISGPFWGPNISSFSLSFEPIFSGAQLQV